MQFLTGSDITHKHQSSFRVNNSACSIKQVKILKVLIAFYHELFLLTGLKLIDLCLSIKTVIKYFFKNWQH